MLRNSLSLNYDSIYEFDNNSQNHSFFKNDFKNTSDISNMNVIDFSQSFNIAFVENNTDESLNIGNIRTDDSNQTKQKINKFLGRKKKGSNKENKGHNKFSYDNLMKKTKSLILGELFIFINKYLDKTYKNDFGEGMNKKNLILINQDQITNGNIEFNQKFLDKTIGEIFSENISKRATNYLPTKNKDLIEELKDEKDPVKKEYFIGLFKTPFSECLKYFRGDDINNKYIEGLKKYSELENDHKFREKEGNNEEYIKCLKNYLKNYEVILKNKKGRKSRKEKEIN